MVKTVTSSSGKQSIESARHAAEGHTPSLRIAGGIQLLVIVIHYFVFLWVSDVSQFVTSLAFLFILVSGGMLAYLPSSDNMSKPASRNVLKFCIFTALIIAISESISLLQKIDVCKNDKGFIADVPCNESYLNLELSLMIITGVCSSWAMAVFLVVNKHWLSIEDETNSKTKSSLSV
jgi:hypothetical protein